MTGCPIGGDSLKVIRAIEENGGVVVAIENCSGVRTLSTSVEEDTDDIYEAIARKYLSTGCSIMTPNDNRIDLIGEIIDEYHVDGVVEMILTGCHATGAESIYIRKFVTEEKHLPYIAVDTDYSTADQAQISTRLEAFLEMIQPHQEKRLDINYCYKIVLNGIVQKRTASEILEEVWKYTSVPVGIRKDIESTETWFGLNESAASGKKEQKMEKRFPEGGGAVMAIVPEDMRKEEIEELLEILVKSYYMKMQSGRTEEKEIPDFLWIVGENPNDMLRIKDGLTEEKENLQNIKIQYQGGKELFMSGVQGSKMRGYVTDKCRCYMKDEDGKVLIGNGFSELDKKEENKKLQQYALKLALGKSSRENVLLVENYYHELAISYISNSLGKEPLYLDELERIKEEDLKKGKELYETLYWYLRMKKNVTQTAAKMKIHRNTLLPRIARINELLELDEKDGMECERILMMMEIEKNQ